ncbi:isocitrate/isopropylmalate family dehydrogenase [Paraburkholderia silvatlantica]|uniref:isocitrate/isopropylmalate family dehydrogenase n=1 Tax=Paraburkholderia silvatlantica TaxID=321895 RepID=UPI0037512944
MVLFNLAELATYVNLRPAFCFPALAVASSLKSEYVEILDFFHGNSSVMCISAHHAALIPSLTSSGAISIPDYETSEIARIAGAVMLAKSLGRRLAHAGTLYEPIYGSVTDIASNGIANPRVTITSLAMASRLQLDRTDLADRVKAAVGRTLDDGYGTKGFFVNEGAYIVGKVEMGRAILDRLAGQILASH